MVHALRAGKSRWDDRSALPTTAGPKDLSPGTMDRRDGYVGFTRTPREKKNANRFSNDQTDHLPPQSWRSVQMDSRAFLSERWVAGKTAGHARPLACLISHHASAQLVLLPVHGGGAPF